MRGRPCGRPRTETNTATTNSRAEWIRLPAHGRGWPDRSGARIRIHRNPGTLMTGEGESATAGSVEGGEDLLQRLELIARCR